MNEKSTFEDWEILFARHRGTEKAVLYMEALRQGLRLGAITSDNLHHIPVVNRKIIGAVMRGICRAGMFEHVGYVKSEIESAHRRVIGRWKLAKCQEARLLLETFASTIDRTITVNETQTTFC